MREFIKKHHVWMKLLAFLLAVILWGIVIYNENPERTLDVADIPVEILGESTLLQNSGLVVSEIGNETVSITLKGTFSALSKVDTSDITVRMDVSQYTEPGEDSISYEVSFPDGVTIEDRRPRLIPIVIEEIVEKELPVRVVYENQLPDGISVDEATVEPSVVRVSGTSSMMEKAAYALVTLDASELTSDYSGECEYSVIDEEGNVLTSEFTRYVDRTVQVDVPVYLTKTIPVEVSIVASAGVPKTSVVTTYEPQEITVYGHAEDVSALKSIKLGEVNVRDFVLTYDDEFALTLPEGVSFVGDPVETVNVHISLRGIDTTQVTVTSISLENVPETAEIDLETTNLEIMVRSQTDKLKSVDPSTFRATVDFTDLDLVEGRQMVPVTVRSSIGGYDVCGTYSVIINVISTGER